ncbi:MAG TPA: hypothetical protein VGL58_10310 [Caulobacteraceae bacterium]|jgi:hypothetical protein
MRILTLMMAAGLALAAGAAPAQDIGSLTGHWQATAQVGMTPVAFDLVVQPNGTYSETERSGTLMTIQSGEIRVAGAGLIAFVVEDWSPKTMPVYHPTGTVGGYYGQSPTTKPPGGVWRMQFNGPSSMTVQDTSYGGVVIFNRVP